MFSTITICVVLYSQPGVCDLVYSKNAVHKHLSLFVP